METETTNTNQKAVTLAQIIEAHQKSHAEVAALKTQVEQIVTAGGEPNVITAINVNGTALEVTEKAVDIAVPTAVSALTNDSGFQTGAQVSTAINTAIARTGHAHFEVAPAIPSAEEAKDNVLYLVKNAKTKHYDIYAKVISDPAFGMFAATYGITVADGEMQAVAFKLPKAATYSTDISAADTMDDIVALMSDRLQAYNLTMYFDKKTGHLAMLDSETGETLEFSVGLGRKVTAGEELTPKTFTPEVVLLDDTTVDLSGYDTAEQSDTKLAGKVDKEAGKGLSTEDFTTEHKAKLDGIVFATDAEFAAALEEIYGTPESEGGTDTPETPNTPSETEG